MTPPPCLPAIKKSVVLEYLGDDFPKVGCRLSYKYPVTPPPVLPATGFTIVYHIRVNGFPLSLAALSAIATNHAESPLWTKLDYEPEAHFPDDNDPSSTGGFEFRFPPISEVGEGTLSLITVDIDLYTLLLLLTITTLFHCLNSIFQTVYINLEFDLPLIFSVYGRALLRLVKPYIDTVYEEMLAPSTDPELVKLEQAIRCLHNTLNVMLTKKTLRGIRLAPYDMRMLRHRRIDL